MRRKGRDEELRLSFYHNKRVFLTGCTGFKGSWLCRLLTNAGADVTGYALSPPTDPSLFELAGLGESIRLVIGDVRDYPALKSAFEEARPEIVFHLAAQPIVRESYQSPAYTYETNVMGTVNLLECVRTAQEPVRSVVIITTDKVYESQEWTWGYRENDPLDGYDPYSNSKSCSELVTRCYERSLLSGKTAVSTVRAGNVIGGGDFAKDRIVPDCIRAAMRRESIVVRNSFSTRPYQHVLEPLYAYLMIAAEQYGNIALAGSYNVGPDETGCFQTGALVDLFSRCWGEGMTWTSRHEDGPHEAGFLKLDCSKLKTVFGWRPRWDLETAMEKTVEWNKCWLSGGDVRSCMDEQIRLFLEGET